MTLWKHILRAHAGPFLFSNAVIIFLFLLQFLMKSAGDIVGKGISAAVVLELIALNLAWIVVLAVPMSVLVASLMGFGKMSADNEIVSMRASGMSLYRMMAPVIAAAALITWGLILFNNRVLPEANIRLRTLMTDILRIKPTLSLQAGIFTSDDQLPNYRILVRKTYEHSNDLEYVTIYDMTRPDRSVVVTARHGTVGFSPDFSKVFMDLDDGEIHELDARNHSPYRKLRFVRHRVVIPASGFGFQRSDAATAQRDDRTMSAGMMRVIVDSIEAEREKRKAAAVERSLSKFESRKAPDIGGARPVSDTSAAIEARLFTRSAPLSALYRALADIRQQQALATADAGAWNFDESQIDKYLVEIYKKYSIPAACIVFVFVGAPLGMMARRGGFGIGAGMSLGFFIFYWACLIGGEKLADRGVLSPLVGMWIANVLLGLCGAYLTIRAARESRVIDWSRLTWLLPRSWRPVAGAERRNPHET